MNNKLKRFFPIILGVVLFVAGSFFSISPIIEFSKRNLFGWKKVTGEITSADKRIISEDKFDYIIGVSYTESVEKVIEFKYSSREFPEFGTPKIIYFNPENTLDFVVGEFSHWSLIRLFLPFSGVVLLYLGILNLKKLQQVFETEEQNLVEISKMQNSEVKVFGEIVNVESEVMSSGKTIGVAIIRAKLPNGDYRLFKSEKIEGLTAGLLVSYLAKPSKISVSVRNGNFDDYYINPEEILEVVKKSFESVRGINFEKEDDV